MKNPEAGVTEDRHLEQSGNCKRQHRSPGLQRSTAVRQGNQMGNDNDAVARKRAAGSPGEGRAGSFVSHFCCFLVPLV